MAPDLPRLRYAESSWERAGPPPDVDAAEVRRRLAPWPALAAQPFTLLEGGLRALVLRVGDVVARLALAADDDVIKAAALHARLAGVVCVPRVVGVDVGARVLLLEHLPHEELPATAEAGAAVGRVAARLHAIRFPTWGLFAPTSPDAPLRPSPTHPSALDALRAWADGALAGPAGRRLGDRAADVARAWDAAAPALATACTDAGLVHGDFKPANLKWRPDAHEVLVLDLEFAWAGPALIDVGQLLRWEVPEPFVAAFATAYVEGGGRLPDGWRRTAELLDLFNLVGLLDHPDDLPVRDVDLLARVARTVAAP